jgi:cytochrome P450
MINFSSEEVRRNPYPVYDQIRSGSPLFHDPGSGLWLVFDYEGVKRALNDHEAFSSDLATSAGQPTPRWLIFFDPPHHTKLRAIITRAFTPRSITNLEPRIRELSRQLLDRTTGCPPGGGEMDLAAAFSVPLPMMVIAEMIGIPAADWPQFRRWSDGILKLSYTIPGMESEETEGAVGEFGAVAAEIAAYLPALIEQRRARPEDDLLTRLVEAEVEAGPHEMGGRLTQEEILAFFQMLLVAGQETTANLINNAVLCFIENPDQLARLRASPDLLATAIEEVLRYRSPLQFTFRATRRDVEMHGQVIPAGKIVLVMMGSANRDPGAFPDAARFDITRDPNPHVAFGHGIHFCLGAALSRLESRIALSELLGRLESFELASDEPWEPRQALHVHGPARLPVRFAVGRVQRAPA